MRIIIGGWKPHRNSTEEDYLAFFFISLTKTMSHCCLAGILSGMFSWLQERMRVMFGGMTDGWEEVMRSRTIEEPWGHESEYIYNIFILMLFKSREEMAFLITPDTFKGGRRVGWLMVKVQVLDHLYKSAFGLNLYNSNTNNCTIIGIFYLPAVTGQFFTLIWSEQLQSESSTFHKMAFFLESAW